MCVPDSLIFVVIMKNHLKDLISEEENPEEKCGSMFVPIIIGSDKTTVSIATGDTKFYPLYMSIGNVKNNIRRAHKDALVLIGFLAIAKSASSVISALLFLFTHCSYPGRKKIGEVSSI